MRDWNWGLMGGIGGCLLFWAGIAFIIIGLVSQ